MTLSNYLVSNFFKYLKLSVNEGRLYNVAPWAISADKELSETTLAKHLKLVYFQRVNWIISKRHSVEQLKKMNPFNTLIGICSQIFALVLFLFFLPLKASLTSGMHFHLRKTFRTFSTNYELYATAGKGFVLSAHQVWCLLLCICNGRPWRNSWEDHSTSALSQL